MNSRWLAHVELAAACALLEASTPSIDMMEAIAEEGADAWFEDRAPVVYRRGMLAGLRPVTHEELAELGIPQKAWRGWAGSPFNHSAEYVDRRCLKRYRRKARRR